MDELEELRQHLELHVPGYEFATGEERGSIVRLLSKCWGALKGSGRSSMAARKLHRAERLRWNPPILHFAIERHGAVVAGGSTRAELQQWDINITEGTVELTHSSRRQLLPTAGRLNLAAVVEEVAHLVLHKADDPRLRWASDRRVTIKLKDFLDFAEREQQMTSSFKQTRDGRLRRLREEINSRLTRDGWRYVGRATYERPA